MRGIRVSSCSFTYERSLPAQLNPTAHYQQMNGVRALILVLKRCRIECPRDILAVIWGFLWPATVSAAIWGR